MSGHNKALAVLLAMLCVPLSAATYYVSTSGDDSNDGSSGSPWRHIWYAASTVSAGDTVSIAAGTYNEWVTNTASGSAGNAIAFEGTRGVGGEWQTIIDPSTAISSWTEATEIASGIYKSSGLPIVVRELTIGGKRVMGPHSLSTIPSMTTAYPGTAMTSGTNLIKLATDAVVDIGDGEINFWDYLGALYITSSDTVYLRLRDGSDPSVLTVTGSPNNDSGVDNDLIRPAIDLNGQSYITWANVAVRGAFGAFSLSGAGCHNNVIAKNYIKNGGMRVFVGDEARNNTITSNVFTCDYYGTNDIGAWEGSLDSQYLNRQHVYLFCKYIFSDENSSIDYDVYMYNVGNSNIVSYNTMTNGIGSAWSIWNNGVASSSDTQIINNSIYHYPSVGLTPGAGQTGTLIHDNYISDCNSNFRIHKLNVAGETNRSTYIYRNKSHLPSGIGAHIFIHFDGTDSYHGTNWIYHNSFSGGAFGFDMGETKPADQTHFINNIMSDCSMGDYSSAFRDDESYLGEFNYNWVKTVAINPAWFDGNNIESSTNMWTTADGMTFALLPGYSAIDDGLDVPTTYPLLPQSSERKYGPAWDIGAVEYLQPGIINSTTVRAGTVTTP